MKALTAAAAIAALTAIAVSAAAQTNAPLPADTSKAVLERVVIVARHGVRPPTKAPESLAKFADTPWPQWPVKPGELTPHGAKAVTAMGAALKRVYGKKGGLLAGAACPAGVFVWADSADQRTRASGDALLKGLGCTAPSSHLAAGSEDPLFDPPASGRCVADPQKAKAAIEARLPQVIEANRLAYEKARAAMQAILTPQGCGKEGQRACFIGEGTDIVVTKDGESRLEGPLANASGLTENLLLEYSEGKPLSEVGWGRAGDKLDEVLLLHNLYADIMRRTPYLASRRGSLLAEQVVDLLTDTPSRFKGAAPIPASAKMVAFLGHDTNLSNMSGFIDTKWTLPGQPDNTPPGAMLAFERWKQPDGGHFVRVRLYYQSLRETRAARATPRFIDVKPCSGSDCTLAALSSTIRKTIAPDCLNE